MTCSYAPPPGRGCSWGFRCRWRIERSLRCRPQQLGRLARWPHRRGAPEAPESEASYLAHTTASDRAAPAFRDSARATRWTPGAALPRTVLLGRPANEEFPLPLT